MSNYEALKAAALAATPGPWYVHDKPDIEGGNYGIDTSEKEFLAEAVVWWGGPRSSIWKEEDAVFIAQANPAVVLSLLAALEEKEQLSFQRLSENRVVRDELGFDADANYVTLMGLRNAIRALRLRAEAAEQRLQHPIIPAQSSNEVNDAAWKLHNMLTEHGPLNGHQFNNLKGCFYEALKVCMGPNKTLQPALADVMEERERQISAKGYHLDHDDTHVNDEIAALAAWYVMPPGAREWNTTSTGYGDTLGEAILPGWNQPSGKDRRRELVIGAALIIAEIERLDRAAVKVEGE
ncbi:ead/Ea22-like family protein [Serratia fonticola]|uniref:ead/Ea22-like family protein n=1 Tax=Serratia fonticola TaxID=47917 RepID=UPI000AB693B8|nr:ead/Ea22-like family protein [Serratia fonticola]